MSRQVKRVNISGKEDKSNNVTSWTINLYDSNLNKLATNTRTLTAMTGTVKWYMVIQTELGTNHSTHIKEIKAEAL